MELMKKKLSNFASEQTLRADFLYQKEQTSHKNEYYTFEELFDLIKDEKITIPDDNFLYAEIGNVSSFGEVNPETLNFNERTEEQESLYKKIEKGDILKPVSGDILLSKIRPYLKKNVLIQHNNSFYYTKAFVQIRSKKANSKIMYYLLQTKYFNKLNSISRCGKGYPTLNTNDFSCLKFEKSEIDSIIAKEKELLNQILSIENEIYRLKETRLSDIAIINKIIGNELNFNWEKFNYLKQKNKYMASFSQFSNNYDCRMSYKFHNLAGKYLYDFLCSKTAKRLKHYLESPILLGESIKPGDYYDDGDYYYLAMSNIKTWAFQKDDCKKVNNSYSDYAAKKGKTIRMDDIVLARSGEGTIGKVALIDEDLNAIFADFIQRIRMKNYNYLCAYYYFRSDLFQYLVYSHKKGMGNNTNIFPNQVQEFPMPDWSSEKQDEIATLIKSKIDEQKKIDMQIMKKQSEILKTIENVIK